MSGKLKMFGLALGIVLIGYVMLRLHDARVRAEARFEVKADSLKAALEQIRLLQDSVARVDALRLAELDSLSDRLAAARHEADTLRMRSDALAEDLRAELPDSVRPGLDSLIGSYEAQIDALHRALAAADSVGAIQRARLAARDSVIAELNRALHRTEEFWQAAEKRARPGLFSVNLRPNLGNIVVFTAGVFAGRELLSK